ncbi:MAG: peptide chain release factor N(5)-glutamine methyltransferase [Fimbriimonadaceae bacterium]|nr:peptide chain release factor N(5)-glutamine methyltransferase [Fimbriimonadaceae bacterium]QYK56051.1 MAG: peptide chain release factor N(5)-glutamine methyltransferase [Fimbriimonadaceae bacterium]
MTLGEWVVAAAGRLRRVGIERPDLEAQVLAAQATGRGRAWVLAHPESLAPPGADALLERRMAHEPLAYIRGSRDFYGRVFRVAPGVLVPRQETETLVEAALGGLGGRVLDVGTGSGCLAITLKLERPSWFVAAVDVSAAALRVARANAREHDAVVLFRHGDLFEPFAGMQFGLIVSNPPYIAEGAALPPDVSLYEPEVALYAGPDGLAIYRRLADEAAPYLMPWGRLLVELGDGMLEAVRGVFEPRGWVLQDVADDLGGVPRAATFARA